MSKHIFIAVVLFVTTCAYSQPGNDNYFYKPFPIYKSPGQVIIAGGLNTFVYADYYGKDVKKEVYINPHSRPEYLIYELFKAMKIKDIDGINKLYDTSFKRKSFDGNRMANMLKDYTDIKFRSKFKSGDLVIIRYDFVSTKDDYAYFAAIRETGGGYYLTMNINISDPFNAIGSYSPYNLFERSAETVSTKNMTPFYFVQKENKVFFTNELPQDDYSAVYLALEFYNESSATPEIDLVKKLQKAGQSGDSVWMKSMIAPGEFNNYYYDQVKSVFSNYSTISPLGTIKTDEGKVLYFKYSSGRQGVNVASIILKDYHGKYFLSFHITDNDISNVLQNTYVREAVYDYFKHRS